MDRNRLQRSIDTISQVALRKESVDRNWVLSNTDRPRGASLSARRAWIEIWLFVWIAKRALVALRKESVDRNTHYIANNKLFQVVALRKESVDRNFKILVKSHRNNRSLSARRAWIEISGMTCKETGTTRRSPQGERG